MKSRYINSQILLTCLSGSAPGKKDIHEQLAETIAERKRIIQKLENLSRVARVIDIYIGNEKAA
jgi:hypothetical protein